MARTGVVSVVVLAVLSAVGAGFAAAVAVTEPGPPADLRSAPTIGVVPVGSRTYDDARTVTVDVTLDDAASVDSLVGGRVTTSSCAPGATVVSGGSVLAVDGAALIDLSTSVPLWRDLSIGDHGPDVAALHQELARLGLSAPDGDRVSRQTLTAFRALVRAIGAPEPTGSLIDHTHVVWLPAPEITVASCEAMVGMSIMAGDNLFRLPPRVSAARVAPLPPDGAPGARVVVLGDETLPVDVDGSVTDPAALSALARSAALATALATEPASPQLSASWRLAEPLDVLVVPPSAVLGLGSGTTCVLTGDAAPLAVTIVGSQLGQTFVVPTEGGAQPGIESVQVAPDASVGCGSP